MYFQSKSTEERFQRFQDEQGRWFQSKSTEERFQDEQGRWILADGPWGTTWLKENDVIRSTNPLMFTCRFCGKTAAGLEEDFHEEGCEHPGITRQERPRMRRTA